MFDFFALRQGFRSSKCKRFFCAFKTTHLHSVLTFRSRTTWPHSHALRRWFFCRTDVAKNGTCVGSKLAMLPSLALHLPCHGRKCQEHMGAATVKLDTPEIHKKINVPCAWPLHRCRVKDRALNVLFYITLYTMLRISNTSNVLANTARQIPTKDTSSHGQPAPILRPFVWWNQMCLVWK